MTLIDFARTTDLSWDCLRQKRHAQSMPRRLADFMKDFNEKNIYHLFTLLMEDQIRMTSEQIFGCCC